MLSFNGSLPRVRVVVVALPRREGVEGLIHHSVERLTIGVSVSGIHSALGPFALSGFRHPHAISLLLGEVVLLALGVLLPRFKGAIREFLRPQHPLSERFRSE